MTRVGRAPHPTPSAPRWLLPLSLVVAALATTMGCHRKLFPANQPRTQFETYDRLRAQDSQTEETDVYGRSQPALRARLTPSTQ